MAEAKHAVVPALTRHGLATMRAFSGAWDMTSEKDAKAWCDKLLKMVRTVGDVPQQTVGAGLMAAAIRAFSSSGFPNPNDSSVFDSVYARCAEGAVWLLKHCRAVTLKGVSGTADLEQAVFECIEALFTALSVSSAGTASAEMYRNVGSLLGDVIPDLTSRVGLGLDGMAGSSSAVALLRALTTALLLFETGMRPYLGPLRGALLRAQMFEHTTSCLQRLAARCWSLVCLFRSKSGARQRWRQHGHHHKRPCNFACPALGGRVFEGNYVLP